MSAFFAKLFDPYDLKARLFPGLLVSAPAVTLLGLTYGMKHPTLAALVSILAACGSPYVLASFVRTRGQLAQSYLFNRWGAPPTTILLRHRDSRLATPTKHRFHDLIRSKLGVEVPSADQEKVDPVAADQAYTAAVDMLRPMTNDKAKYPFVFKELVAYGFNRNAYGIRWAGVTVAMLASFAALLKAGVFVPHTPYLDTAALFALNLANCMTLAVAALLLLLWLFHFTDRTVEQAGFSYALRLLEALDKVSRKPGRKSGGQDTG